MRFTRSISYEYNVSLCSCICQTSLIQAVPVQLAGILFLANVPSGSKKKSSKRLKKPSIVKRATATRTRVTATTITYGQGESKAATGSAGHQRAERRAEGGAWPRLYLGVAWLSSLDQSTSGMRCASPKQLCSRTDHYGQKCQDNYIHI